MGTTERFEAESTEPKAEKSVDVRSDRFDEKPSQRDGAETPSGAAGSRFYLEADLSNPANRGGAGSRAGATVPSLEIKDQEGSAVKRTGQVGISGGGNEKNTATEPKSIQKAAFEGGTAGGGGVGGRTSGAEVSKQNHGETGRPAAASPEITKTNQDQGRAGTAGQGEKQTSVETKPNVESRQQAAPAPGKQAQELNDARNQGSGGGGFNRDGQQPVEKSTGEKLGGRLGNDTNAQVDRAKVTGDLNAAAKPEQNPAKALDQNPSKSLDQQNPAPKAALPALEIKQQPEAKNADRSNAIKPDSELKGKLNDERSTKVAPDQVALDAKKANVIGAEQKTNQVQTLTALQQQAEKNAKPAAEQVVNAAKDQSTRTDANTLNRSQLDVVAVDKLNKTSNSSGEKTLPALSMLKASETETADKGKKKNELNDLQQFPIHSGYSASKSEANSAAREITAAAAVARENQMARTSVDANAKLDLAKIQAINLSSAAQSDRAQTSSKPATEAAVKVEAVKVDASRIDVRRDEQRALETGKVSTKDGAIAPAGKDALTVGGKDFTVIAGKDGNFSVGGRNSHNSGKGTDASNNPSGDLIVRGGRIAGFSPINAQPGDREGTIRSINAETGRRYLTGAEIGLLIALAGIAKKRSDDVSAKAESCQKNNSEVEKKAEPIKKLDERKASETESKELDIIKRFPGKEITVSAMIAFTGVGKGKEVDYQQAASASNMVTTQIERTLGTTVRPEKSEAKSIQTASTPMGAMPYSYIAATESKSNQKYDGLDLMQLLPSVSIMRSRKKSEELDGEEEAIESQENTAAIASLQDERETHKIASGETLLSIAEKRFGDEKLGWLIANLNANKIKETKMENRRVVEIMIGEKLVLPTAKEIRQFHEHKDYNVPATHLVTILIERSFDRAFIDEQLSIVFGCQRGAV